MIFRLVETLSGRFSREKLERDVIKMVAVFSLLKIQQPFLVVLFIDKLGNVF